MPLQDILSFQLYSARAFPPLEDQLAMLRRLGYTNVEPFGGLYDRTAELSEGLKRHGLTAKSGHANFAMVEADPGRMVAIARELGMQWVVIPYLQPEERPTDQDGWEAIGQRLSILARTMRDNGLRLAYHNHDFEFRPLPNGRYPIELLLTEGVDWEADLAWVTKAGVDPLPWLSRYVGQVPLIHVKDIAPAGEKADEDGWADVGTGTMNWPELWQAALDAGAELMIAEHDAPRDAERFARVSAAAMTTLNAGAMS